PMVRVRKKMAQVLCPDRAKNRVANRVDQHVSIGMAVQTFGKGNLHTAQVKLPSFDQLMHIVADADMVHGGHRILGLPCHQEILWNWPEISSATRCKESSRAHLGRATKQASGLIPSPPFFRGRGSG